MQDAIVVGAGMAGSAAALKLSRAGIRSVVFEARDRVGGRGYLKPFGGEGEALEYGGAWITPTHGRIRSLVKELGLALRPRHPVTRRLWLRDGEIHDSGPTSEQDRAAHERALARVAADALLLKKGHREDEKGRPLTGVTFADYLDRLNAPPATRALFSAWWTVSGSGDHRRVAASEFLASCTYADGLAEGMIEVWADTVVPGMAALAQRMLDASGATLHLSTPVKAIDQDTDGVSVTTANGTTLRARHAVLAMGVNQMQAIRFSPPLPEGKAKIVAARHGGRAFKLWLKVKGVPVGTLVTGDGTGIEWAFAERERGRLDARRGLRHHARGEPAGRSRVGRGRDAKTVPECVPRGLRLERLAERRLCEWHGSPHRRARGPARGARVAAGGPRAVRQFRLCARAGRVVRGRRDLGRRRRAGHH